MNDYVSIPPLIGMHRKSIEAADKLKDSDAEQDENSRDGSQQEVAQVRHHHHHLQQHLHPGASQLVALHQQAPPGPLLSPPPRACGTNLARASPQQLSRNSSPVSPGIAIAPAEMAASAAASSSSSSPVGAVPRKSFKEELRSTSIASLRAKAQEHSAKVLSEVTGKSVSRLADARAVSPVAGGANVNDNVATVAPGVSASPTATSRVATRVSLHSISSLF